MIIYQYFIDKHNNIVVQYGRTLGYVTKDWFKGGCVYKIIHSTAFYNDILPLKLISEDLAKTLLNA